MNNGFYRNSFYLDVTFYAGIVECNCARPNTCARKWSNLLWMALTIQVVLFSFSRYVKGSVVYAVSLTLSSGQVQTVLSKLDFYLSCRERVGNEVFCIKNCNCCKTIRLRSYSIKLASPVDKFDTTRATSEALRRLHDIMGLKGVLLLERFSWKLYAAVTSWTLVSYLSCFPPPWSQSRMIIIWLRQYSYRSPGVWFAVIEFIWISNAAHTAPENFPAICWALSVNYRSKMVWKISHESQKVVAMCTAASL